MMSKKSVLVFVLCVMLGGFSTNVFAFGIGNLTSAVGGGSGNTNWGDVEGQSVAALADLYAGQAQLSEAVADLAEVVGLKEEAAMSRGQIEKLKECGSSSCSSFSEVQKSDESLAEATIEKFAGVESLTADQKEKSSEAMKKYLVGGILYAKGVKDVKSLSEQAIDAPALQKPKFLGLIKAAPVAAKGATNIVQTAPKLFQLATTNEIEYPEEQKDEMMSALTM